LDKHDLSEVITKSLRVVLEIELALNKEGMEFTWTSAVEGVRLMNFGLGIAARS